MITDLLKRIFSSDVRKENVEERPLRELREYEASHASVEKQNAVVIEEPTRKDTTSNAVTTSYASDIAALEECFGCLYDGMVLELDLRTLLSICPRERRKSDSYKGLKSQLRRNGVTLSIVNTPNKNGEIR